LNHVLDNKKGTLVAVSSLQGKISVPFRSAYSASKHALQALYDSLKVELSEHKEIKVCLVSPGYFQSNLSVNALTADGSSHGKVDFVASRISSHKMAKQIFLDILNETCDSIQAPLIHKSLVYVRVLCPRLYFLILRLKAKAFEAK